MGGRKAHASVGARQVAPPARAGGAGRLRVSDGIINLAWQNTLKNDAKIRSKLQRSPPPRPRRTVRTAPGWSTEKVAHGILAPYHLSTARLRLAEALSCRILLKEVSW